MIELNRKFLRCLIKQKGDENLKDNIFKLLDKPLNFTPNPIYNELTKFVKDFYEDYNDYPTVKIMQSTFEERANFEALDELKELGAYTPHTGESFQFLIDQNIKELNRMALNNILKDAVQVNNSGLIIKKKKLEGTLDAVQYIINNSERFYYTASEQKSECEMSESAKNAYDRYEEAKKTKFKNYGVISGIKPLDLALKGIKKKNLLLVAGATGECKTTFCLNYAYYAAVHSGYNVLYITLEMSKEEIQDIFYCLHVNNPRIWNKIKNKKGQPLFSSPPNKDLIKDGKLSESQEVLYRSSLEDWKTRGKVRGIEHIYGSCRVWEPPSDLTPTLLRSKVGFFHKQEPIDLLIVDQPSLMSSDTKENSETATLNQIMKKMKSLARTFNHGEGIPVICPFQINRDGKKTAEKKEFDSTKTMYSTYHLAYANEAERSADFVIYTYLNDDLREQNQLSVGCIKNRHGRIFTPFLTSTKLESSLVYYEEDDPEIGTTEELTI